jgi:regulator of RNase E activity RraA
MPSHAHTDVVDFDKPVSVAGMVVHPGDLIHADRHGAVVVPHEVAAKVPEAAALIGRREKVILDAARSGSFSLADLRRAFAEVADIH